MQKTSCSWNGWYFVVEFNPNPVTNSVVIPVLACRAKHNYLTFLCEIRLQIMLYGDMHKVSFWWIYLIPAWWKSLHHEALWGLHEFVDRIFHSHSSVYLTSLIHSIQMMSIYTIAMFELILSLNYLVQNTEYSPQQCLLSFLSFFFFKSQPSWSTLNSARAFFCQILWQKQATWSLKTSPKQIMVFLEKRSS